MNNVRSILVLALAALLILPLTVRGDEPPHYTFSPVPPGTITQNVLVYLAGQAMHSQWRAVASRKNVAKSGSLTYSQWYLSIYSINATTYSLKYRSPDNGGPLSKVTKAKGAPMWFPYQEITIVGAGQFMVPSVEQLVVASHETGADCGGATVTVFALDKKTQKPAPSVTVTNGCALSAAIVHEKGADAIKLSGPYYSPTAALCCPTKTKASAMLRYRNGKWAMTPKYYTIAGS
jgi:hypothetical protein